MATVTWRAPDDHMTTFNTSSHSCVVETQTSVEW